MKKQFKLKESFYRIAYPSIVRSKTGRHLIEYFYLLTNKKIDIFDKFEFQDNPCEGKVLIVLDKGLGDFILFAYYLECLLRYYSEKGQKVYITGSDNTREFLKLCNTNNYTFLSRTDSAKEIGWDLVIAPFYFLSYDNCSLLAQMKTHRIIVEEKNHDYHYVDKGFKSFISKIESARTHFSFYTEGHRWLYKKITGRDVGFNLLSISEEKRIVEGRYYLINTKASSRANEWPMERWAILMERLKTITDSIPVVIGNADVSVTELYKKSHANVDYMNSENIKTALSLCQHADFVITPDTGIYHLGVMAGAQTFVIYKSVANSHFAPYVVEHGLNNICYVRVDYNCDNCKYYYDCGKISKANNAPTYCMNDITVEDVFSAIEERLL